jgi:hypothetical protein
LVPNQFRCPPKADRGGRHDPRHARAGKTPQGWLHARPWPRSGACRRGVLARAAPLGRRPFGARYLRRRGVGVRLLWARGEVAIAEALATGPREITAARNCERGANMPDSRCNGNRGGGIDAASLAKHCTGVITRVAPLRLGMHRRYATRPSGRIDERSKLNGGRAVAVQPLESRVNESIQRHLPGIAGSWRRDGGRWRPPPRIGPGP